MTKYSFSLLILVMLTALQCKKVNLGAQLPPITTNGANTFGCLVNGNVWLPGHGAWNINWGGPPENELGVSENFQNHRMNGIEIFANYFASNASTGFDLNLIGIVDTGTFKLKYYNVVYFDMNAAFVPFDTFAVVHILRCDTVQKIISGTFSFMGYTDSARTQSATFSDGRFDLHYPLTIR